MEDHKALATQIVNKMKWTDLAKLPHYSGVCMRVRNNFGRTPLDLFLNGYEHAQIANIVSQHGGN